MSDLCEEIRAVSPDATGLCTELMADPQHRLDRADELKNTYGIEIPFLFSDFDPKTTDDEEISGKVDRFIDSTNTKLDMAGVFFGSRDYVEQFVRATRTFVQNELKVRPEKSPTFNAVDTIRTGFGPCVGIDLVYYGIFLLAGLDPEIQFQFIPSEQPGELRLHTRLALSYDDAPSTSRYIVDAAMGVFGERDKDEPYIQLSPGEFIALTYVNQLFEAPSLSTDDQLRKVELSLALSESNPQVHFMALCQAIRYYESKRDWANARHYYNEAVLLNPAGEKALCEKFPETTRLVSRITASL